MAAPNISCAVLWLVLALSGALGAGRPARPLRARAARHASRACSAHEFSADETFATAAGGRLPARLAARAAALGFERPTAVQAEALGVLLDGHDAIVHASTGSGKTLAYLLPLLAGVDPSRRCVQAVVIVPTRELGLQVAKLARQLAAGLGAPAERPSVMLLLDRSHAARERRWLLAEPPHVVVGNPEAVQRAVSGRALRTGTVRLVVVDEADECAAQRSDALALLLAGAAAAGALPAAAAPAGEAGVGGAHAQAASAAAVSRAAAAEALAGGGSVAGSALLPPCDARQTVFVSASIPQHRHFLRQCVGRRWMRPSALHVHVAPSEAVPASIAHRFLVCEPKERVRALRQLLRAAERAGELDCALVFCRDGRPLDKLAAALASALDDAPPDGGTGGGGARGSGGVLELRADDGAAPRYRAMAALRSRKARVLVCELGLGAHRGLDLPAVSHVLLLDSTADARAYLHAAGRCGRLGRAGLVVTLVGAQEVFSLKRLANALQIEIQPLEARAAVQTDAGGERAAAALAEAGDADPPAGR